MKVTSVTKNDGGNPSLMDLPDDLQFEIWQFLEVDAICATLTCVNQRYHHLLQPNRVVEAAVWMPLCRILWPWLNALPVAVVVPTQLDHHRTIPITTSLGTTEPPLSEQPATVATASPAFSLLLPLATTVVSDAMIRMDFLSPRNEIDVSWNATPYPAAAAAAAATAPVATTRVRTTTATTLPLFTRSESDSSILQFTGAVGTGNRCLVSQIPLPRPLSSHLNNDTPTKPKAAWSRWTSAFRAGGRNATIPFKRRSRRLRRLTGSMRQTQPTWNNSIAWNPLIFPFFATIAATEDQMTTVLDLSPRLISYFEVSILPQPEKSNNDRRSSSNEELGCVAVGLATERFRNVHDRIMPGWDRHSFGYHGDDGGMYHGSGHMMVPLPRPLDANGGERDTALSSLLTSQPFPRFGAPGDCIGCGVDYHRQVIFYTLNGLYLGPAFDLRDTNLVHTPLFPVVGVDTNRPIRCNYGTEPDYPFVFDLQSRIREDREMLLQTVFDATDRLMVARGERSHIHRGSLPQSRRSRFRWKT